MTLKGPPRLAHTNRGIVDAAGRAYTLEEARWLLENGLAQTRDHKLLAELGCTGLTARGGYRDEGENRRD